MTSPGNSTAEKRAKALELHLAGVQYKDIAHQLGFASAGYAHKLVQQALDEMAMPSDGPAAGDQATAIARLDAMLAGVWSKARRGDVQAIDRVLKIEERRLALQAIAARQTIAAPPPTETPTSSKKKGGLSEFEKRLRDRERATKAPRRTTAR